MDQVTLTLPLPMAKVLAGVEGVVEEMAAAVGLLLMEAAMDPEVARLVGPRHQRRRGRRAGEHQDMGLPDNFTFAMIAFRLEQLVKRPLSTKPYGLSVQPRQ